MEGREDGGEGPGEKGVRRSGGKRFVLAVNRPLAMV